MTDGDAARRLVEGLFNDGDPAVADDVMVEPLVARWKGWAGRLRDGSSDMTTIIELVVDDGAGNVALLLRRRGTHTGPVTGPFVDSLTSTGRVDPTGALIDVRSSVFLRFEAGRVVDATSVADNLTLFQQLGVIDRAGG